jgi:hypothetical protein
VYYRDPVVILDIEIQIAAPAPEGCVSREGTVVHELIHSLRRGADINDADHGHADSGIFQAEGGNGALDAASLEKICEVVECTTFNPERSQ